MNRTLARALVTASVVAAGPLVLGGAPANAASTNPVPPGWLTAPGGSSSSGLGFCWSQVAQHPEYVGTTSFGAGVHQIATSAPGALPGLADQDRYPLCGGPGSGQ